MVGFKTSCCHWHRSYVPCPADAAVQFGHIPSHLQSVTTAHSTHNCTARKYWSSSQKNLEGLFNNSHTTPETLKHFPGVVRDSPRPNADPTNTHTRTRILYMRRNLKTLFHACCPRKHWVECQQEETRHGFTTKGGLSALVCLQKAPNLPLSCLTGTVSLLWFLKNVNLRSWWSLLTTQKFMQITMQGFSSRSTAKFKRTCST